MSDRLPPRFESAPSVRPTSAAGIRDALDEAADAGRRVLIVGTAVDLRPLPSDAAPTLLRTGGLAGIEAYEPADLTLTAGAGTPLSEIQSTLAEHGQWLPVDPPGADRRTLGGLVATGAAGPLSAFYGAPRDHVLGATLVTGDGTELSLGGRVMKNVAGFDLVRLVVGSRGALGVVTSATVRVFPRPAVDRRLVVEGSAADVLALGAAMASAPRLPASCVVVSDGGEQARLVVRVHGSEAAVGSDAKAFEAHLGRRFDGDADGADPVATDAVGPDARSGGAAHGTVRVRAAALPAALPRVWDVLREAMPEATLVADALSGQVRASTEAAVASEALRAARGSLEELGGSLILTWAPDDLAASVGVYGRAPAGERIARTLVERFDTRGLLLGGRWPNARQPDADEPREDAT